MIYHNSHTHITLSFNHIVTSTVLTFLCLEINNLGTLLENVRFYVDMYHLKLNPCVLFYCLSYVFVWDIIQQRKLDCLLQTKQVSRRHTNFLEFLQFPDQIMITLFHQSLSHPFYYIHQFSLAAANSLRFFPTKIWSQNVIATKASDKGIKDEIL